MNRALLTIEQTGSPIRCNGRKRKVEPTLRGLGLSRIGATAQVLDTPATRGMIERVKHLVQVTRAQINNSGDLSTRREDPMPRCIYCRAELNNNVPPNDMTASLEHIVSLALGGTNAFSTNDASRKYNNDLGRDIDAPFMNLPLLAMKRHMLGLKGHSGTFPLIEWKIRSTKNGEPGTITIDDQGNIDVRFDPVVITDKKGQHTKRLVAGSPDRVREILDGMLNAAKKKGEQIYTLSGEKI